MPACVADPGEKFVAAQGVCCDVHDADTLSGINRELMRSPPMVLKTWLNWVIGTAPPHTVLVFPLIVWGTEKKYCDNGEEAIPAIVPQGVLYGGVSPEVQPEVSEP